MVERGLLFLDVFQPVNMIDSESVVNVKCGDSGVAVGYWVDEFTRTWSVECFVAQSYIYLGII